MSTARRTIPLLTAMFLVACSDPTGWSSPDASLGVNGRPAATGIPIVDLGTLGGRNSAAYGVNDLGVVVGSSATRTGVGHAFVWTNGTMTDLGMLAGASASVAYDINEAGVIVGAAATATDGSHPVRWLPLAGGGYGAPEDLGSLGGCCGDAQAINDGGQITGFSQHLIPHPAPTPPDTVGHTYLWQTGAMSDIHPLALFAEADVSFTWGINNAGTVVGQQDAPSRGFVRFAGGTAQLLAGIGGPGSVPLDVNTAGVIVGWSQATANDQLAWHATLWSGATPQDLGTLGGASSVAIALTDESTPRVVGRSDSRRGTHPFVWTAAAGMKDLGLPKGSSFGQAWDINGNGWVVGETSGAQQKATLWKLPAP